MARPMRGWVSGGLWGSERKTEMKTWREKGRKVNRNFGDFDQKF